MLDHQELKKDAGETSAADFIDQTETLLQQLFQLYDALEKRRFTYSNNTQLTPSEVRAVQVIGQDNNLKMVELAAALCISKGNMSKMAARLEQQGLIRRLHYLNNRKDIYFQLTPLGRQVSEQYSLCQREWSERLRAQNSGVGPQEAAAILRFLQSYKLELLRKLQEAATKGNENEQLSGEG